MTAGSRKEVQGMKRKKTGLIAKIALVCLVAYAAVNLVSLQLDINRAEEELSALNVQLENQKRKNVRLEEITQTELNEDLIAEAARTELGFVAPGERIFIDISN